jgi:PAS domain S-box-containing protein
MFGTMGKTKDEHKIVIGTLIAVTLIWTTDAAVAVFVLHEGAFKDIIQKAAIHDLFPRIILTLSAIAFGIIIARILEKHNRIEAMLKKHAAAIESSMDGIAVYDRDNRFTYVNQSYATINGYSRPDELIGKSYTTVYEENEILRMKQVSGPELQKSAYWRGELQAKRKNGSLYFQEASVTLLEDGGQVSIIRDITWRKRSEDRLRRSEQFLNTLFDSIRDPFCIFDRDYQIVRVNDAYAQMKNKLSH